jgi:hypothetical protein
VDCLADIPDEFKNKPLKPPPQFMPQSFPDLKDIHQKTKPLELVEPSTTIVAIPSPRQPLEFQRPLPLSSNNEVVKKNVSFNPVHEPETKTETVEIV